MDTILERGKALEDRLRRANETAQAGRDVLFHHNGVDVPIVDIDPDGVLLEAVSAISSMSMHRKKLDLTVMLGPDNTWGCRIVLVDGVVRVTPLTKATGGGNVATVTGAEHEPVSSLADLLRAGPP